jgi:hypothetical protein
MPYFLISKYMIYVKYYHEEPIFTVQKIYTLARTEAFIARTFHPFPLV